jgi:hypothetical protein
MALITASIGTGARTFASPQAWEDTLVANLVTDGNARRGEVYNDSGAALAGVDFSAHVTDATNYIEMTAASGQSFQDNPSVRSAALTYADTVYAALSTASTYAITVNFSGVVDYFTMSRLMVRSTAASSIPMSSAAGGCNHHVIKDNIFSTVNDTRATMEFWGTSTVIANCLFIHDQTSGDCVYLRETSTMVGCTVLRTANNSTAGGGVTARNYSTVTLQSTAIFGYTTPAPTAGVGTFTNSKNNATQAASGLPGTSNQHSVSYTSTTPFTQANASGNDCRAIAGTSLDANGFKDSTNAPSDITAYARPSTPTIGAHQLTVGFRFFLIPG